MRGADHIVTLLINFLFYIYPNWWASLIFSQSSCPQWILKKRKMGSFMSVFLLQWIKEEASIGQV